MRMRRVHVAQREYGRLSGGVPLLLLPQRRIYVGLGHFKHSNTYPQLVGSRRVRTALLPAGDHLMTTR